MQLPYYIDGDLKICESSAIIRHIARKHNLYGATEREAARADMMDFKLYDFKWRFYNFCYGVGIPNYDLVNRTPKYKNYTLKIKCPQAFVF